MLTTFYRTLLTPSPRFALLAFSQLLVASAKSFEEFVGEQLREDGSGRVLRKEGATGLLVPRGSTLTQTFVVAAGCYLCWEFLVEVRRVFFSFFRFFVFSFFVFRFSGFVFRFSFFIFRFSVFVFRFSFCDPKCACLHLFVTAPMFLGTNYLEIV